ncbi:MAG: DUF4345 family protein [Caulobacter sp.]|nr:DUF4345 family protein [Caulobacter sp.]
MAVFGTLNLAVMIAVVACCIGGAFGGLRMARPRAAKAQGRAEERAFAGALILSHAGAAMALGYAPSIGGLMAVALALGWLGAGLGRAASLLLDRARDPMLRQGLVLELLMAVCLALPWLNIGGLSLAPSVHI